MRRAAELRQQVDQLAPDREVILCTLGDTTRGPARDAVLQATGLRVIRIPAWRCLQDPDKTAGEIRTRL